MQRKPRKDKLLFDITVDTKMTGIMKYLAECECSGENIKDCLTFTTFGLDNDVDLIVAQAGGAPVTWILSSSKMKQFVSAAARLEPKHVIVQYYA